MGQGPRGQFLDQLDLGHQRGANARVTVDLDAQIVNRFDMTAGQRATGPAAVVEDETTIIVPASRDAICQPDGCIDLVKKG